MGIFESLQVQQGAQPPAPEPQQQLGTLLAPRPAQGNNPMRCAKELSGLAARDQWGRVIKSLSGRDLPPRVVETGYVKSPNGGYLPIENPETSMTYEMSQLLEQEATEWEKDRKMLEAQQAQQHQPVAPPPMQAEAPRAAWAPPGMQPPPPAQQQVAQQPPAPQFRPPMPPQAPSINPPEAQQAPGLVAMTAPPGYAPQYAPPPPAAPQAPAPEAPKARRGRPKKDAAAQAAPAAPAQQQAPTAPQGPTSPGDLQRDPGFCIFLNCRPVHGFDADNYDLSDILRDVREVFRVNHQVDDYALMDHGKGQGLLGSYVEQRVRQLVSEGDVNLTIDMSTREASICLNKLLPFAGVVVIGK